MNTKKIPLEKIASILDAYEFVLTTKNIQSKDWKKKIKLFLNKKQRMEYAYHLINKAKKSISEGRRPIYIFRKIQWYMIFSKLYDRADIKYHNDPKSSF